MNTLRIAYLTGEYPRATDTFIQREVAELRKMGMGVETFSVRRTSTAHHVGPEQQAEVAATHYLLPPSVLGLLRAHVCAVVRTPIRYLKAVRLAWRTRQPGLRGALYQAFYLMEAGLVVDLMRRLKCDHLHNHFANSSCNVTMLASELGGFPFSFTMHGPAIFFEPKLWALGEKIARAKFVACISHFSRSQGMAFVGPEHWHKMRIVHCGIDPAKFDPVKHEGQGCRLTYVGRLAAVKGLPVLLEALAGLPKAVRLSVVGDGPDRELLEAMADKFDVSDRVDWLGYRSQSEVREQLAQTDVFVMSSFAEGVPVVLMEAMAAGVPVVATRIAGIAELVQEGKSGLLVSPGDEKALRKSLETLIQNPEMRQRFGEAGRAKVAQAFSGPKEADWLRCILVDDAGQALRPDDVETQNATSGQEDNR